VGVGLDPALVKSDKLSGNMVGYVGKLPPIWEKLNLEVHLLKRLVGSKEQSQVKQLRKGEALMLSVGSAVTVGVHTDPKNGEFTLKLPVCAEKESKVAFSRMEDGRWRLIGYGIIK